MKRVFIYISVLLAGMAISSCSKEINGAQEAKTSIALDLKIGQADTRVAWNEGGQMLGDGGGTFEATDVLGLYIRNDNEATQNKILYIKENVELKTTDVFYFEDLNATQLRFSAHYPKQTVALTTDTPAGDPTGFELAYDASTATASTAEAQKAAYEAADLLVATGTTSYERGKSKTVSMEFKHALGKVEVNISNLDNAGLAFTAEQLNAATVTLLGYSKVKVDLITPYVVNESGDCILLSEPAGGVTKLNPVYCYDSSSADAPSARKIFLLAPQVIGTTYNFISISFANPVEGASAATIEYRYKLDTEKALKGNEKWTFNFKVGLHKIVLDGFTISNWDNTDPVTVTPDSEFDY